MRRYSKGMPKVSSKNQVTIPVDVLRETGIKAGDDVVIRAAPHGEILIQRRGSRVREHAGIFSGMYEPGYLDALRDEWER